MPVIVLVLFGESGTGFSFSFFFFFTNDLTAGGGFPQRKTVTWSREKIERSPLTERERGVIHWLDDSSEMNGEYEQS